MECEFVADKELLDEKINDPNFAGWSASGYLSVKMHHYENEFAVKSFVKKITRMLKYCHTGKTHMG